MPASRRPALARLHAWTGVILALPLLLLVLSGTAMLFKDALFVPASWRVADHPVGSPAVAAADTELARLLRLPALQDAATIQLARGVRDFHQAERPGAAPAYWRTGADRPASDAPWRLRLEHQVLELHARLLLGEGGTLLLRVLAPLLVALVLLGLVLWWPLRRGWRGRDLLPQRAARPQLLRAHLALGGAAGLLFLVHLGSGLLLAWNPLVRAWLEPRSDPRAIVAPAGAALRFAPGDATAAIAALRGVFPDGVVTQLAPVAGAGGAQWSLKLRLPGERHPNGRSSFTLDLAAGRIVALRDARRAGAPATYDDLLYPLHIGRLFGGLQRALWLAGALALALLVGAGALAFLRRSPQRTAPARPRTV